MDRPEVERSPEAERPLTERDIQHGILMSVAIQAQVREPAAILAVLPDDLREYAERHIPSSVLFEHSFVDAFADYLNGDEIIRDWITQDEEGDFVLSEAGCEEMTSLYNEGFAADSVKWNIFDTVVQATAPKYP